MKKIRKTHPPKPFLDWLRDNEGIDCSYGALQGKPAHIALKQHLLREQGYLCAYTGIRITEETSHIEHLKPQTACRRVENRESFKYLDDVAYHNMVACFPKDGGDTSYGYGAPMKGSWWNKEEFVSPCRTDCEQKFSYGWKGKVAPTDECDTAAKTTIDRLGLGLQNLEQKRRSAIKGFFGFSKKHKTKELSQRNAKDLLNRIGKPDSTGKLTEFCFIFEQLLPKYIKHP